jgi:hypothetical protein
VVDCDHWVAVEEGRYCMAALWFSILVYLIRIDSAIW